MSGKLFIISTPIGNLQDLSNRARSALSDAQLIMAEDTRVTLKLLTHLGLKKKLLSCHKFNEKSRLSILEESYEKGECVALVSDAGTPLLSDPGALVVERAIELGYKIVPVAGPTALILALTASGLPCERFCFEGFLPEKRSAMLASLEALRDEPRTIIFYIARHDLPDRLADIQSVLGDRPACLAREMTKKFEEFIRCSLSEMPERLTEENLKGEFTLVVAGAASSPDTHSREELEAFVQQQVDEGLKINEIAKVCAERFSIKKSDAYRLALETTGRKQSKQEE